MGLLNLKANTAKKEEEGLYVPTPEPPKEGWELLQEEVRNDPCAVRNHTWEALDNDPQGIMPTLRVKCRRCGKEALFRRPPRVSSSIRDEMSAMTDSEKPQPPKRKRKRRRK
jgi:hypothetical protein